MDLRRPGFSAVIEKAQTQSFELTRALPPHHNRHLFSSLMRMNTERPRVTSERQLCFILSMPMRGGGGRPVCLRGPGPGLVHTWQRGTERVPSQPSRQGPALGSRPLPQLTMGLVTKTFPRCLCLSSPSVIGEVSGPQGGPHKPHRRLPIPTPQERRPPRKLLPILPVLPPPLPSPCPSPPSPPSPPPHLLPSHHWGSTSIRLPEGAASPPTPAGPQNKKTTIGKHRKGGKNKPTKLRGAFVYKEPRPPAEARLCSASKPGILLCLGQSS